MALPSRCPVFNTQYILVPFVVFLMTFIPITSQVFIIFDFLGGWNIPAILHLAALNGTVLLLWRNYYLGVMTDPGRIPEDWVPGYLKSAARSSTVGFEPPTSNKDQEEDDSTLFEVKKSCRRPRYCRTCKVYKPPRSHHCSSCGRCVLKMDHHCPWLGNCVGHHNYNHFFRFLIWVDIATGWCFALLCARVWELVKAAQEGYMWRATRHPSKSEGVFLIVNMLMMVPVLLSVGGLSVYQLYCMLYNTTTIESWEKDKVSIMVRRGRIKDVQFPYDLGFVRNIKSVLGSNPLLWLWPRPMETDGLSFPIADRLKEPFSEADAETPVQWPPAEYDEERTKERQAPSQTVQVSTKYLRRHIRRGSEGYEVRDISIEERRAMMARHDPSRDASKRVTPMNENAGGEHRVYLDSETDDAESAEGESSEEEYDGDEEDEIGYRSSDDEDMLPPPNCTTVASDSKPFLPLLGRPNLHDGHSRRDFTKSASQRKLGEKENRTHHHRLPAQDQQRWSRSTATHPQETLRGRSPRGLKAGEVEIDVDDDVPLSQLANNGREKHTRQF